MAEIKVKERGASTPKGAGRNNQSKARQSTDSPLTGRIFDRDGHRMTPTYATKKGVRYRYYVSSVLIQGRTSEAVEPKRVPAIEIEILIASAIRGRLQINSDAASDRDVIRRHVIRVDVTREALTISLMAHPNESDPTVRADADLLVVPYKKMSSKRAREILGHNSQNSARDRRPIRSETRLTLVSAIAKGRRWLNELVQGAVTSVDQIAARENCSIRQVNMTISLAFLSPTLVSAAIEGRLPRGIGIANLRDAPLEWSRQMAMLGLAS